MENPTKQYIIISNIVGFLIVLFLDGFHQRIRSLKFRNKGFAETPQVACSQMVELFDHTERNDIICLPYDLYVSRSPFDEAMPLKEKLLSLTLNYEVRTAGRFETA